MVDVRIRKLSAAFALEKLSTILPQDKKKLTIAEAMALAICEAYKGAQLVSPNPLVGCVILDRNGCFLSKGHHEYFGGAHAEINALGELNNDLLQDATLVVTLEPCAHIGKTGSCALRINDLPIKKVIYGIEDPNPLVAGKGAQIIRDSCKEAVLFSSLIKSDDFLLATKIDRTNVGIVIEQLEIVAENFLKNYRHKIPFVALKWAQSIDGKMALRNFESQWITNEQSRSYAHYLRSLYDVTMVGSKTVLNDNPKLNIRIADFEKENKIVIIDPKGTVYQDIDKLEISKYHKTENIFFVVDANASKTAKASNLKFRPQDSFENVLFLNQQSNGFFSLDEIHQFCFERNMKSILVEGGPSTLNQYFNQEMYDRVYSFIAPVFLGNGIGYSDHLSIPSMADKLGLSFVEKLDLGDDILVTGTKANK